MRFYVKKFFKFQQASNFFLQLSKGFLDMIPIFNFNRFDDDFEEILRHSTGNHDMSFNMHIQVFDR